MTTKRAAALAALDANVEIRWNEVAQVYQAFLPHTDQQAYTVANMSEPTGVLVDDYAAAAEALGLESRYVVTERERGICFRCGRESYVKEGEQYLLVWGYNARANSFEWVCPDGCNGEEEKDG